MNRRTKIIITAGAIAGAGVIGTSIAVASGGEDGHEKPITGAALESASAAALAHTGGGRVTGTEVGDEESYYEVEVTKADGRAVDVQLDEQFKVVGDKVDNDSAESGS